MGSKLARMTKETEAKWAERVRDWQASGVSAEEFAAGKGFKASSLQWAASQLRVMTAQQQAPRPSAGKRHRTARAKSSAVSLAEAPRFLPVRTRAARTAGGDVLVEVGSAQIRVTRGFDASLLVEVVRALGGGIR